MANSHEPVILELAPLPREQIGPFLLLGLSKSADQEDIEANWAQRIIWARKKHIRTPLEDINWAREVVNDFERRVRADVTSLNVDTAGGILQHLVGRYGGSSLRSPAGQPLDREKPLADYTPPADVPDLDEVKNAIQVPAIPQEVPAVGRILEQYIEEPLDPWNLPVSTDPNQGTGE
jgi:hypothetical protein